MTGSFCLGIKKYRVVPKSALFCFSFQSRVLQSFFLSFSGGLDSMPGRFFWHQYGSNWTIYYAAADKNLRSIFCHKTSSSDVALMLRDFGRNNAPHRRAIQHLVAKFWETESVADGPQMPEWSKSFKSFKSNKPCSFSILWLISPQNVSRSASFW